MGAIRNAYNTSIGKPEGKRPLGRPRRRWEIRREGVDWMHLAQDTEQWLPVVNTVMNLRVLHKMGNFLTSSVTVSFSRSAPWSERVNV